MKKTFPTIILLFFTLETALFCQTSTGADSPLLRFEDARFSAMIHKDTARLRAMLDEDLIYLHSNGMEESKNLHLAAIGTGDLVYNSLQRQEGARIRKFGKVALVNGQVKAAGSIKGKPFDLVLKYTAVYRKKAGHWLLLNWQSTRL